MQVFIMARHVIELNYSSIGIENVGGETNKKEDLTPAQVHANIGKKFMHQVRLGVKELHLKGADE